MGIITKTNTFVPNTVIESAKVNENFDEIIATVNGNLTSANLADNAVTTKKITDFNVTENKIALGAITEAKIADNSISTAKIQDGAVTADKVASDAIATANIQDDAITADKLSSGAITADALDSGVFTALQQILIVADEKPAGTSGGTFTSGAWRTRDLNTVRYNTITGASLASNQITLPAGTYYISASAPAYTNGHNIDNHKAKLRNITTSTDTLIGTSESFSNAQYLGQAHLQTRSFIVGVFTIEGETTFEIQHRCYETQNNTGFGKESNMDVAEVYSQVFIQKIG